MNSVFPSIRVLLCVILSMPLHAQFMTLSGWVSDRVTAEALPYASVVVKHSPLGTIANAEGAFTIHLPLRYTSDTLTISMIGFEVCEVPIAGVADHQNLQIRLKHATSLLPEVIVRDTLTPLGILQRAHDRIKDNYINSPFIAEGFYREVQKNNGHCVSLVEAAVSLHSDGYRKGKKETVRLDHLRRSTGYENPYVPFWEKKNLLLHFIKQNYAKYNSGRHLEAQQIVRLEDTSIEGVSVYVLRVGEKNSLWPAQLYIRCDNYAIIRAEEQYHHTREGDHRWTVESAPFITSNPQEKILRVDYAEYEGKYYARNYLIALHILYKNSLNDALLLDFNIVQQFVVTDMKTRSVHRFTPEETLREDVSLKKLPARYDPAFWAHYNIAPLDTAQRQELERQMPLEEQFRMP